MRFMRAPDFWRRSPPTLFARALTPVALLYGAAAARRLVREAPHAALPAIVIGGPTVGGDGKTPLALAVAALLRQMGETPAFLTRGYGRRVRNGAPFRADPARDDASTAGDEALLLARIAPTIIGADRVAGAALAATQGASALILDDGLHSRRLSPDLALGVVDSLYGLGNGLCLPAGPLRAPGGDFFRSLDAVVIVGEGARGAIDQSAKPLFAARLIAEDEDATRLLGRRALAFAGIARASKFETSLREAGVDVIAVRWFADHHRFSQAELESVRREANALGATLVTTRKDAARLSPDDIARFGIESLGVRLVLREEQAMKELLGAALRRARLRSAA